MWELRHQGTLDTVLESHGSLAVRPLVCRSTSLSLDVFCWRSGTIIAFGKCVGIRLPFFSLCLRVRLGPALTALA